MMLDYEKKYATCRISVDFLGEDVQAIALTLEILKISTNI